MEEGGKDVITGWGERGWCHLEREESVHVGRNRVSATIVDHTIGDDGEE